MRSMALGGIMFKSTAAEPRPTDPFKFNSAEVWRRLPLTKTSVWSGAKPRNWAGRIWSVPSVIDGRGKLKLGSNRAKIALVSVKPVSVNASELMTSIGTAESAIERSRRRVPVTAIRSVSSSAACALLSLACWAIDGAATSPRPAATQAVNTLFLSMSMGLDGFLCVISNFSSDIL